jgi:hypothetical protein
MKNDSTTIFLNFVLAALVILGVTFALLSIYKGREQRRDQIQVQMQLQSIQMKKVVAQALLNDVVAYNNTAKSPELNQILQSVRPPQPAK